MINDDITPAQRKKAQFQARRAVPAQSSDNEYASELSEDEIAREERWHKWETSPTPPEMLEATERNLALLAELQKKDPTLAHVQTYGTPKRATPEMIQILREAVEKNDR